MIGNSPHLPVRILQASSGLHKKEVSYLIQAEWTGKQALWLQLKVCNPGKQFRIPGLQAGFVYMQLLFHPAV